MKILYTELNYSLYRTNLLVQNLMKYLCNLRNSEYEKLKQDSAVVPKIIDLSIRKCCEDLDIGTAGFNRYFHLSERNISLSIADTFSSQKSR